MKIGLITVRYGLDINGGAEFHCRMLAERLSSFYQVEVLTTTIRNYVTFENPYPIGLEQVNQINVRRFANKPFNANSFYQAEKKAKWSRKIRRIIYRLGLSQLVFKLFPIWRFKLKEEYEVMRSHRFYSENLLDYVQDHQHEFDAFIFFSYENPLTQLGGLIAPKKTILMPAAHMEGMLFRSINTHLFAKVAHIAFNTETEMKICQDIFQQAMAPHQVVAVGTSVATPADSESVKLQYDLPERYLLYCGRVTQEKLNSLIPDFLKYKKEYPSDLRLVLTGDVMSEKIISSEIFYTGFVSEPTKTSLMNGALAIINPSTVESLSLLTLEALSLGKYIIANKRCQVMMEHERRSLGAVKCYGSYKNFTEILNDTLHNPTLLEEIRDVAQQYVTNNYDWDTVIGKYKQILTQIKQSRPYV